MSEPMEQLKRQDLEDLRVKIEEAYESSVPLQVFLDRQRATPGSILSAVSLEPGDVVAVREARGTTDPE
jgi:RNA binding exosome subunit